VIGQELLVLQNIVMPYHIYKYFFIYLIFYLLACVDLLTNSCTGAINEVNSIGNINLVAGDWARAFSASKYCNVIFSSLYKRR
jgi:hypothetical protein